MTAVFGRWVVTIAVSCAIAGALVQSFTPEYERCPFGVCPWSDFPDVRIRRSAAGSHEAGEWGALRDASDIALAARVVASSGPSTGAPTVWFAPDVGAVARASVRRALGEELGAGGTWRRRGGIAVLVLVDSSHTFEGLPALFRNQSGVATRAIAPSPATTGRCVSVVRLGKSAATDGFDASAKRSLLDACGFFDAFGAPGRAIAAALDSGRYDAARAYLPGLPDSTRQRLAVSGLVGGFYATPPTGIVQCATGADSACTAYVMGLVHSRPYVRGEFSNAPRTSGPVTVERYEPAQTSLFDLIALDLGPERFARFWHSDAPLPDAYREVAGVPITNLMRRVSGGAMRYRFPPTGFGMRLTNRTSATLGSSALVILTIAALFGFAAFRSPRATAA